MDLFAITGGFEKVGQLLADAWNICDPAAIAAVYQPDGVRHEIATAGRRLVGTDEIARGVGEIIAAWPDCRLTTHLAATCNDGTEVLEWTFAGTSRAPFGALPATTEGGELRGVGMIATDGGLIPRSASTGTPRRS